MASITKSVHLSLSASRIQSRLLVFAGVFLGLYALALSLAPAARARSWEADYRWNHWLGYLAWGILIIIVDRQTKRYLPDRDPYLFPVAALLSGWGLMTIWRLFPDFGFRQTMWFVIVLIVYIVGLRLPTHLEFLRRYKYVLLTGGLILTALTLLFGTNPASEAGPHLWLGCCGVYFQPSEPLKLLLIIYLSAYLADKQPWVRFSSRRMKNDEINQIESTENQSDLSSPSLSLLTPILFMTGLTLLLLMVQRDLGTATIFVFLFAVIVYLATERKLIMLMSAALLLAAGISSYLFFDVVRLRIDAWLNPWLDPSGRSYQIVQSLMAIANGGVGGRGPGMGSPTLVPISHSDFVFSAIVEESGLMGGIAIIGLLMLLTASGIRIALWAPDNFRRFLAAGLTAYLIGQSLLIIGGNIRLLPLTGVTLPFVSYGGSSLLTAFLSLLLLTLISQSANTNPVPAIHPTLYTRLGALLFAGLSFAALVIGWWTYVRGPALLERTDNARRAIADRYVRRGEILDRNNNPLVTSTGEIGDFSRIYNFPELGSLVGYSHAVYGQSGLEASLDPYLRGLRGHSSLLVWWHHLLYGQPPSGLDVRLSIDMDLQRRADEMLGEHTGALVLMNAGNGEVLALASHPTYDPNQLEEIWSDLINDETSPLLNRAIQGQYQPGTVMGSFLLAEIIAQGELTQISETEFSENLKPEEDCAVIPEEMSWAKVIAAGCRLPQIILSEELGADNVLNLYENLGLFTVPDVGQTDEWILTKPVIPSPLDIPNGQSEFRVSPLQMVRAAATLSSGGIKPAPQLASAINLPQTGWTGFPPSSEASQVFSKIDANRIANTLADDSLPIWQTVATTTNEPDQVITWYLAGTLPTWTGSPFSLVILMEDNLPEAVQDIGQAMMEAALQIE